MEVGEQCDAGILGMVGQDPCCDEQCSFTRESLCRCVCVCVCVCVIGNKYMLHAHTKHPHKDRQTHTHTHTHTHTLPPVIQTAPAVRGVSPLHPTQRAVCTLKTTVSASEMSTASILIVLVGVVWSTTDQSDVFDRLCSLSS